MDKASRPITDQESRRIKNVTQTLVLIVEGRRHHVYIEFESDSEQLLHPPKKLFCQVFGRVCLGYTQT